MLSVTLRRLVSIFAAIMFIAALGLNVSQCNAKAANWEVVHSANGKTYAMDKSSGYLVDTPFGHYRDCRFKITNADKSYSIIYFAAMLNIKEYAIFARLEYDSNGKNISAKGRKVPQQSQLMPVKPGTIEEVLYNAAHGIKITGSSSQAVPEKKEKPSAVAIPSAGDYVEVIGSLPVVGSPKGGPVPSYAERRPGGAFFDMVDTAVIEGTYGSVEFKGIYQRGYLQELIIQPAGGKADTSAIADDIVAALTQKYGAPTVSEKYLWDKGQLHGLYGVESGIIDFRYGY